MFGDKPLSTICVECKLCISCNMLIIIRQKIDRQIDGIDISNRQIDDGIDISNGTLARQCIYLLTQECQDEIIDSLVVSQLAFVYQFYDFYSFSVPSLLQLFYELPINKNGGVDLKLYIQLQCYLSCLEHISEEPTTYFLASEVIQTCQLIQSITYSEERRTSTSRS